MGLTKSSSGKSVTDVFSPLEKKSDNDCVIALAGNPNVGKSTVFNALTGMNQHTGNWPGKTVSTAVGYYKTDNASFALVDIPGTYSLLAHSAEEEVARNFICFGGADGVIVVCDATCLERNLNLVLQTLEITDKVIICVNLMDEARRKNIGINIDLLSQKLGVNAIGTVAQSKSSLSLLQSLIGTVFNSETKNEVYRVEYPKAIENAISILEKQLISKGTKGINSRWLALKILDYDESLMHEFKRYLGAEYFDDDALINSINSANDELLREGIGREEIKDIVASCLMKSAEDICKDVVTRTDKNYSYKGFDRKLDEIFTGKYTAFPIMLLLLAFVFWLTISGANYPSELLSRFFGFAEIKLYSFLQYIGCPLWLNDMITKGAFRVPAWVVSVMLPPMAIFFPLFTLLEDFGYLPRVAFNLDKPFKKCKACGKQSLTMCMGLGCNAAGIVGCRIIDSKRERLLAILTNNFIPCNGRFPTLIALITMLCLGNAALGGSVVSALILTLLIAFSILISLAVTKLLSQTLLKGTPSSFILELPPYRRPQIWKLIVRSVFDRTLFVLGRALCVSIPAGIILWCFANISIGDRSILNCLSSILDPFGRLMGLDGVILLAFILGLPANEIVLPIAIMIYMGGTSINSVGDLTQLKYLLIDNGWTVTTTVCMMFFTIMHWPCSTSLLTIKKETGSVKWMLLSAAVPTVCGVVICICVNLIFKLIGILF